MTTVVLTAKQGFKMRLIDKSPTSHPCGPGLSVHGPEALVVKR